jgi:zeaxanthin glucosyltransferase
VSVFQVRAAREKVQAQGLDCVELGGEDTGSRELDEAVSKLGSLEGLEALRFTIDCARRLVHAICRNGPALVGRAGVDLLLVDQNEPAGGSVAEHLGLPFLSVCSGLPLNRCGLAPPPFVDWSYSDAWWARWRNGMAYAVVDRLLRPVTKALNFYRRQWELPDIRQPDDTFSPRAQLCTLVPELEFPRPHRIRGFHYTGPLLDNFRPAVPFPFHRLNGKRLIYASFGTLQNRMEESFYHVAAAVARLDAQLVITLGGGLTHLRLLPGSPIVVNYAPQMELLARASLCVTHGGLNTIMEALSCGVPLVVVPVANDQPANAARVEWSGAGEYVRHSGMATERFHEIVQAVLEQDSYRQRAGVLARSIAQAGGVRTAVRIVEEHLNLRGRLRHPA